MMGLFNKKTKITPQNMGKILYEIAEYQTNIMRNTLNDFTENRHETNRDAALLIPVMYNFYLYEIVLSEKHQIDTVYNVLDAAFGIMQIANRGNRYIYEKTFVSVYGLIAEILKKPYVDTFNNPYQHITDYYLKQVYGDDFKNINASLVVRESFGNWSATCKNMIEEYKIIS